MSSSSRSLRGATRALAAMSVALFSAACATTGATFNSGVGDAFLERPPYRAGADVTTGTRVVALPITYQSDAAQAAIFDPSSSAGSPIATLLAEMNVYVDSLGLLPRTGEARIAGVAPDVQFGCLTAGGSDECDESEQRQRDLLRGDDHQLRLAVGRPSPEWTAGVQRSLTAAGADLALVLTLEVGQYWVTKTGWRNDKSVALGSGYSVALPWLTSLETPVSVLQITGAVVDRNGKAVRIGAEGLMARRTPLLVSSLRAQALLSDEDVQRARTLRRDDLPGRPLAWQVALRHLVADLAAQPRLVSR
jgi:hypothetical protein